MATKSARAWPPNSSFSSPPYLQPGHSWGAWRSRDTWGTLRERRWNQRQKRELHPLLGAAVSSPGGQAAGRWRTRGETEETSDTHLRARLPGAAHPKSRSTLGGSGSRKRRGQVTGNVHTKRRAAREAAGWGAKPCGALAHWHQARLEARPLPRRGRLSAPLTGMPEKMGSPRGGQEHSPGSPWKDKSLG